MGLVQDKIDRLLQLQTDRLPWSNHWLEVARYALPDAERFDGLFLSGTTASAIDTVVSEPVAAKRSKEIFDQTSLWAVDRGANGTISLVTPQTRTWHDLVSSDPFAAEPTDEEKLWYETFRDYLFETRGNPRSGFWAAHKAAVRCVWAFGTAVEYVDESRRGASSPISYRYCPISENHLACDFEENIDTNYRLFRKSARQCVERWGAACSRKTQEMADDQERKDKPVLLLHAVQPRAEKASYGTTNRNSPWSSCYIEVDEKHLIGEGGYFEFPFVIFHWQRNNPGPWAEGPMALALAEVKSLNMLAKTEMRAASQWIDPPYGTHSSIKRLDLNPRAVNAGAIDEAGRPRFAPIVTSQRPDFARAIIDARRDQLRTTLYIDLWQTIINSQREQTAYEVLIKNQEKGDLLGPIGTSLQTGLSYLVDRESGILARRGAYDSGSPLEPPDSLRGMKFGPRFTSPLDKLRRLPQLQGMTQWAQLIGQVAQFKPEARHKLNADEFLDIAAEILDVPRKAIQPEEVVQNALTREANAANAQAALAAAQQGGEAGQSVAGGLDALSQSPAAQDVVKKLAGVLPGGSPGP